MTDIEGKTSNENLKFQIKNLLSSGIDPIRHLQELDYPRRAGTAGDKKAADYLVSTLKNLGCKPIIQKFHYWKPSKVSNLRYPFLLLCWGLLTLNNILFFSNNKLIGLITLLLPLVIIFILFRFKFVMKFYFKQKRKELEDLEVRMESGKLTSEEYRRVVSSQNVIVEVGNPRASQHILFTAHFDSISLKLPMKITKYLGIFGFFSFILFSLIYMLNFMGEIYFEWDFMPILNPIYVILLVIMLIQLEVLLISRSFRGNESHGIIDDGSGVAILLELVKFLKQQNLSDYKFTFGFFSAEEAGLIGSSFFYRKTQLDVTTHVISIDMIGEKPPLAYVQGINPLIRTKMNPQFNEQIDLIAKELDLEVKGSNFMYPGSDFAHWLYAGYRSNWLINGSKFIHSKDDNVDNVNKSIVEDALKLLIAYLILVANIEPVITT